MGLFPNDLIIDGPSKPARQTLVNVADWKEIRRTQEEEDCDPPPMPGAYIDEDIAIKKRQYKTEEKATTLPPDNRVVRNALQDSGHVMEQTSDSMYQTGTKKNNDQNQNPSSAVQFYSTPTVRPPPACMMPRPQRDQSATSFPQREQSIPSIPVLEATLVEEDPLPAYVEAIPLQIHEDKAPEPDLCWVKKYKKLTIVVSLLVGGGLTAVVLAVLFSRSGDTKNTGTVITPRLTAGPSSSPITIHPDSGQPVEIRPDSGQPAHISTNATAFSPDEQVDGPFFGEAAKDLYGLSVALSDGGMTLAVGAPGESGNDNRAGYVKVYHREDYGSSWKQQGETMIGEVNNDRFGHHVALSSNGKILAIGAPGHWREVDRSGYVQVYSLEDDGNQLVKTINGDSYGDEAGESVSLSGDGRTLACGAPFNDKNGKSSGLVRVYQIGKNPASIWNRLGQDIVGEANYDNSGFAISLSVDGKRLAIGAYANDGNGKKSGHVRVYCQQVVANQTTWKQLGQDIDGKEDGDRFGHSVSLSDNGKTLAIGAPGRLDETGIPGYVSIYHEIVNEQGASTWNQPDKNIDGEAVDDRSGTSVSLSADGNTVAIGANTNDAKGMSSGHVRIYHMYAPGSSWRQLGQDIDGKRANDNLGWSVALSADGETLAIGAHRNDSNGTDSGHVKVFQMCLFRDGLCP